MLACVNVCVLGSTSILIGRDGSHKLPEVGRFWPHFGRSWPDFGFGTDSGNCARCRPSVCPILASRPDLLDFDRLFSDLDPCLAGFGQLWTMSDVGCPLWAKKRYERRLNQERTRRQRSISGSAVSAHTGLIGVVTENGRLERHQTLVVNSARSLLMHLMAGRLSRTTAALEACGARMRAARG